MGNIHASFVSSMNNHASLSYFDLLAINFNFNHDVRAFQT